MPKCSKYHAILLLLLLLLLLLRLLLLLLLLLLFLLLHLLLLFLCLFFFFTILYVAPTTQLQPSYNPAMMFILALPGPCFHYLDTYFSLYWIWLNVLLVRHQVLNACTLAWVCATEPQKLQSNLFPMHASWPGDWWDGDSQPDRPGDLLQFPWFLGMFEMVTACCRT